MAALLTLIIFVVILICFLIIALYFNFGAIREFSWHNYKTKDDSIHTKGNITSDSGMSSEYGLFENLSVSHNLLVDGKNMIPSEYTPEVIVCFASTNISRDITNDSLIQLETNSTFTVCLPFLKENERTGLILSVWNNSDSIKNIKSLTNILSDNKKSKILTIAPSNIITFQYTGSVWLIISTMNYNKTIEELDENILQKINDIVNKKKDDIEKDILVLKNKIDLDINESKKIFIDSVEKKLKEFIESDKDIDLNKITEEVRKRLNDDIRKIIIREYQEKHNECNGITHIIDDLKNIHAEISKESKLDDIKEWMFDKLDNIVNNPYISNLIDDIDDMISSIKDDFHNSKIDELLKKIKDIHTKLENNDSTIIDTIKYILQEIKTRSNEIDDKMTKKKDEIITDLYNQISNMKSNIIDIINKKNEDMRKDIISEIHTKVTEAIAEFRDNTNSNTVVELIKLQVDSAKSQIKSEIQTSLLSYVTKLQNNMNNIKIEFESTKNEIKNNITEQFYHMQMSVNDKITSIYDKLRSTTEQIQQLKSELSNKFKTAIDEINTAIIELKDSLPSEIETYIDDKIKQIQKFVNDTFNATVEDIKNQLESNSEKIDEQINLLKTTFTSDKEEIQSQIDALQANSANLKSQLDSLSTTVTYGDDEFVSFTKNVNLNGLFLQIADITNTSKDTIGYNLAVISKSATDIAGVVNSGIVSLCNGFELSFAASRGQLSNTNSYNFFGIYPDALGSKNYNPIVQEGDHALITGRTGDSKPGGIVICPWSSTTAGTRMDNLGNFKFYNGVTANIGNCGYKLVLDTNNNYIYEPIVTTTPNVTPNDVYWYLFPGYKIVCYTDQNYVTLMGSLDNTNGTSQVLYSSEEVFGSIDTIQSYQVYYNNVLLKGIN